MGLSYMVLNFFKEIAKMSLELLGLLMELLLLLLLLLLHVFNHVVLRVSVVVRRRPSSSIVGRLVWFRLQQVTRSGSAA